MLNHPLHVEKEELLKGLLDRLIIGLRDVDAWDDYVDAVVENDALKEIDFPDFTEEQMAASAFWRINGVEIDEVGEVRSQFDTESESPDDDSDDAFIVSLADWLTTFEKEELAELKSDGSFRSLANMCRGIYEIGIEVVGQKSVISVDMGGNCVKRAERPTYPLSDEQVNEILRKRRGYGLK